MRTVPIPPRWPRCSATQRASAGTDLAVDQADSPDEIDSRDDDLHCTRSRYLIESRRNELSATRVCAIPLPDDPLHVLVQSSTIDRLPVIHPGDTERIGQSMSWRARRTLGKSDISILIAAPSQAPRR